MRLREENLNMTFVFHLADSLGSFLQLEPQNRRRRNNTEGTVCMYMIYDHLNMYVYLSHEALNAPLNHKVLLLSSVPSDFAHPLRDRTLKAWKAGSNTPAFQMRKPNRRGKNI